MGKLKSNEGNELSPTHSVDINFGARLRFLPIVFLVVGITMVVSILKAHARTHEGSSELINVPKIPRSSLAAEYRYVAIIAQRRANWYAGHAGDRDWNDQPEPLDKIILKQEQPADRVMTCYYNTPPSHFGNGNVQKPLMPHDINPYLCTHINVAFATVVKNEIYLDSSEEQTLREVVELKTVNPTLKVLLSVRGSSNDRGFPEMVSNHTTRKQFIRSIKEYLNEFSLDGIDLDWEFPSIHSPVLPRERYDKRERQHFSQLLREIRMEYNREKKDYWLTVAAAAPRTIVDISYDVDQLNLYTDFVNIMTYDFHYFSEFTPYTGFNSPLLARPTEKYYLATLNINYTVHMYLSKGLDKNKIVVGVPTYGHTFRLINYHNTNIGSPAAGYGSLGSNGFVNTGDLCVFIQNKTNNVTVVFDNAALVPYMYKHDQWISFETPESVTHKAKYIKKLGLRGAMVYSLNADDYEGVCKNNIDNFNGTMFPLCTTLRSTLMRNRNE